MTRPSTPDPAQELTREMPRPGSVAQGTAAADADGAASPKPDPGARVRPAEPPRADSRDATAPQAVPPEDLLADGRYVMGRTLGTGGMGVVRHARDRLLHRDVAVKLLADHLAADDDARRRFLREARAAASIVHPNVVAVYDVGTVSGDPVGGEPVGGGATAGEGSHHADLGGATDTDAVGRPYLVMELVDGPSLANVLEAGGPLAASDVVDIAADALAGIGRAHDAGLLHRDVKPGNLLRGHDRTVKVTDFGVAEAADVTSLTVQGTVVGTRAYLAPERRRGEAATIRTDLYALGVTLAELLTGTPPEPDRPPALPEDTPPHLRELVTALLAPDATVRPWDTTAALRQLQGQRDHGAARRRRAGSPTPPMGGVETEPPPRDGPRRRRVALLAGGAAALATAAVLTAVTASDRASAGPGDGEVRPVSEDPAERMRELSGWLRGEDTAAETG